MTAERPPTEDEFERKGLLRDLEPTERKARLDLLRQLAEHGVGLDELKRAVEQERLALLPIELLLRDEGQYTFREYGDLRTRRGVPTPRLPRAWNPHPGARGPSVLRAPRHLGPPAQAGN